MAVLNPIRTKRIKFIEQNKTTFKNYRSLKNIDGTRLRGQDQ